MDSPTDKHQIHVAKQWQQQKMVLCAMAVAFAVVLILLIILGATAPKDEPDTPSSDVSGTPEATSTVAPTQDPSQSPSGTPTPTGPVLDTVGCSASDIQRGNLIVVNATHRYTFPKSETYLCDVYGRLISAGTYDADYKLRDSDLKMNTVAFNALDEMLHAYHTATGDDTVMISSAYRTYEQQELTHSRNSSASLPGYSDSHTGLSCALNVIRDDATYELADFEVCNWIYEHADAYGFVVRYPEDKAKTTGVEDYTNYFRYVGVPHAAVMKERNLCLEEYVAFLKSFSPYGKTLSVSFGGEQYEIYYIAAGTDMTSVPILPDCTYSISGDNESGFIVTCKHISQ